MSATARRISLPLFISIALVAVIILGVYRHPARGLAAQPQVPNSIGESADAAGFAMAAERDISELQDGITVSQWKTHHVGQDKEIPARPGSLECVSLKSEARISGGRITRLVLF